MPLKVKLKLPPEPGSASKAAAAAAAGDVVFAGAPVAVVLGNDAAYWAGVEMDALLQPPPADGQVGC